MNQREMLLADLHHWSAYQLGPDARLSANEVTSLCDTLLMYGWTRPEAELTNDGCMCPCDDCGAPRTKDQGGETFTICDMCWDKYYRSETEPMSGPILAQARKEAAAGELEDLSAYLKEPNKNK